MAEYLWLATVVLLVLVVIYLHVIKQRLAKLYDGLNTVQGTQWEYQIGQVFPEGESFPLKRLNQSVRDLGKLGYEAVAVWMNPENIEGRGILVLMKRPIIR